MLEDPVVHAVNDAFDVDLTLDLADIEAVLSARRVEDLWEFLSDWLHDLGFCRVLYGLTQYKTPNSLGDPRDLLVLSNLPKTYVDQYVNERLYHDAQMVRWAIENVGARSWSYISERISSGDLSQKELEVIDLNNKYGLTAGYTIGFGASSTRVKAGIGLALKRGYSQEDADKIWHRHGRQVQAMCNIAHLQLLSLPHYTKDRKLTDRQREVLEWVGEGKTTQDIATILGLTAATVEKHLRRAREVLDVDTTAQAVLKASYQNQIFILKQ